MRDSPRIRRLKNDYLGLEKLRLESTIVDFDTVSAIEGCPPEQYLVRFLGKGLWRPPGMQKVFIREQHEVDIRLGASYPRTMPDLKWRTPIFHPNISSSGSVCLGGYGKHWVPGLQLDELCHMLWDMVRYENYDIASPFNREAASWAQSQSEHQLPVDSRPIRNRVAGMTSDDRRPPIVAVPRRHLQNRVCGVSVE